MAETIVPLSRIGSQKQSSIVHRDAGSRPIAVLQVAGPIPEHATYNRILSTPPRLTTVDLSTTSPTIQVIDPAPSPIPSSPVTHCPLPIAHCPLPIVRSPFPIASAIAAAVDHPCPRPSTYKATSPPPRCWSSVCATGQLIDGVIHHHLPVASLSLCLHPGKEKRRETQSTSFDKVIGCTDPPYRCSSSIHRFRHPSRFNAHIHNGESIHRQPTCLRLVLSKPRHLPKVSGSSPSLGPRSGTPFPDSFSTSSLLSWRRPQQIRQLKPSS